jgi:hypothetical protein
MGWFWNSKVMSKIESGLVSITNSLWRKRRAEEKKVVEKIKESTAPAMKQAAKKSKSAAAKPAKAKKTATK